jgi:hypothetical protein
MKLISLFLLFYSLTGFQKPNLPGRNVAAHGNPERVNASLLIGKWESTDSLKYMIQFVDSGFQLRLVTTNGLHEFSFSIDSLHQVETSTFLANWPPYDCDLNFISSDTLEVVYSSIGSILSKVRYVRKYP